MKPKTIESIQAINSRHNLLAFADRKVFLQFCVCIFSVWPKGERVNEESKKRIIDEASLHVLPFIGTAQTHKNEEYIFFSFLVFFVVVVVLLFLIKKTYIISISLRAETLLIPVSDGLSEFHLLYFYFFALFRFTRSAHPNE